MPPDWAWADWIWGPWTEAGNPCVGTEQQKQFTFGSQSTYLLPVAGKPGAFIFMADRWRARNAIDGRHVWLPVLFRNGRVEIEWRDGSRAHEQERLRVAEAEMGSEPLADREDLAGHVDVGVLQAEAGRGEGGTARSSGRGPRSPSGRSSRSRRGRGPRRSGTASAVRRASPSPESSRFITKVPAHRGTDGIPRAAPARPSLRAAASAFPKRTQETSSSTKAGSPIWARLPSSTNGTRPSTSARLVSSRRTTPSRAAACSSRRRSSDGIGRRS